MAIESLDFREEADVERVLVENTDRVVWVRSGNQTIAGVLDGLQVSWCHKSSDTRHGEVFHCCTCAAIAASARASRERLTTPLSVAASIGALTRSEKLSSTVCRPATEKRSRRSASASRRDNFSTHSSSVDARNPLTPSCTIVRFTPTAAAITGTPQAMNSIALKPHLP